MALSIRFLSGVEEVPEAEWDALTEADDAVFAEWRFLSALERHAAIPQAGWTPSHLAMFSGRELVCAVPTYLKTHSAGEFVFDFAWADASHALGIRYYPKLVVAIPFTPAQGPRVLVRRGVALEDVLPDIVHALLERAASMSANSVHILFPRREETARFCTEGFFERLGCQYHFERNDDATLDDYLARFSSKRRHAIRREMLQPAKDGVDVRTLRPEEVRPELASTYHTFYRSTVDQFFYGQRYLNRAFFADVFDRFRHRLAPVLALREGEPVAGAFNVTKGSMLYGRYWGATVDLPFLHFNVCYYEGVRHALATKVRVFEPGAGGEHKRSRGFSPTLTHSVHWIHSPRLRGLCERHATAEAQALRAEVGS